MYVKRVMTRSWRAMAMANGRIIKLHVEQFVLNLNVIPLPTFPFVTLVILIPLFQKNMTLVWLICAPFFEKIRKVKNETARQVKGKFSLLVLAGF